MNLDQLKDALKTRGWSIDRLSGRTEPEQPWHAWRRLDQAANCTSNRKPPSLVISPFRLTDAQGQVHESLEIEIRGEVGGLFWTRFTTYGVRPEQLVQQLPKITKLLRASWNAAANGPSH